MNAGPTAHRVYEDLRRLVTSGLWPPGAHLDPVVLASELASSTTPVRDALNRLTGEGLVEQRQGSGCHLPLIDEPALKDVYAWIGEIIALALKSPLAHTVLSLPVTAAQDSHADRVAGALFAIAAASGNAEHAAAMASANARLHAVRVGEPAVLGDAESELAALENAIAGRDIPTLRQLCRTYVRRRRAHAGALLRRSYRHS